MPHNDLHVISIMPEYPPGPCRFLLPWQILLSSCKVASKYYTNSCSLVILLKLLIWQLFFDPLMTQCP